MQNVIKINNKSIGVNDTLLSVEVRNGYDIVEFTGTFRHRDFLLKILKEDYKYIDKIINTLNEFDEYPHKIFIETENITMDMWITTTSTFAEQIKVVFQGYRRQ